MFDHPLEQSAVPIGLPAFVTLTRPGLSDQPTRPTLGDPKPPPNVLDGRSPLLLPIRGVWTPLVTGSAFGEQVTTASKLRCLFRYSLSIGSSQKCSFNLLTAAPVNSVPPSLESFP